MSKALRLHQTTVRAIIHKWKTGVNLRRSGWPSSHDSSKRSPNRTTSKELHDSLASAKVHHKGEVTKYKYFVFYCTKVEL